MNGSYVAVYSVTTFVISGKAEGIMILKGVWSGSQDTSE